MSRNRLFRPNSTLVPGERFHIHDISFGQGKPVPSLNGIINSNSIRKIFALDMNPMLGAPIVSFGIL